ncbi:hypothetical protein [Pseudoclavibacter endophyticus]|uniref:Uncharacterized protein n=1 Tax=Pseudoclavibacter endophyticus TaxID=1778590 RepID=A0A6H9WQI9_9MICO|nr:hypothetical protein [Pseudoclavibacter endophyticus]KAB1650418.1 hypothetical protein F8O04_09685 [Pseudoclavibacter endophyticus]
MIDEREPDARHQTGAERTGAEQTGDDPTGAEPGDRFADVGEHLAEIEAAPLQERAERYSRLHEQLTRALDETS